MFQKYVKNILITSGIIAMAWANTYVLYADQQKVEDLSFQVKTLEFELEQSTKREVDSLEALEREKRNIEIILSQKQREEELRKIASSTPKPAAAPVQEIPIIQEITVTPVVTKPTVVKATKPSRSSRAS